jgi:2-haloalkanoic acid dehalogenase type II
MRPITGFTTLTFDCYGTLIDWERGLLDALQPWRTRAGVTDGDEEVLQAFGEAEAEAEAAPPFRHYPQILEDVVARLATRWSVPVDPGEARRFGESVGDWPPFADTPSALQYLKQHYKLVIVSNVDYASFARTERQLGVPFALVVTAQDVGAYKPDPRTFQYALEKIRRTLGVEPAEILHTAQSLFHDIVPAKALGLATMWIDRRRGRPGPGATPAVPADGARPDFVAGSLEELVALHKERPVFGPAVGRDRS